MLKNGGSKIAGRTALIAGIASLVLVNIAYAADKNVVGEIAEWVGFGLLFVSPIALVWWGIAHRETERKPGASPLIAAVIALPVCALAVFSRQLVYSYWGATLLGIYGVLFGLAAVALLIVGVVKKLAA